MKIKITEMKEIRKRKRNIKRTKLQLARASKSKQEQARATESYSSRHLQCNKHDTRQGTILFRTFLLSSSRRLDRSLPPFPVPSYLRGSGHYYSYQGVIITLLTTLIANITALLGNNSYPNHRLLRTQSRTLDCIILYQTKMFRHS